MHVCLCPCLVCSCVYDVGVRACFCDGVFLYKLQVESWTTLSYNARNGCKNRAGLLYRLATWVNMEATLVNIEGG